MSKGEFAVLLIILGVIGFILSELMGLWSLFVFTIVFGLIGFATSKLLGVKNPYKVASDLTTMLVFAPVFIYALIATLNPSKAIEALPTVLTFWFSNLPAILIGDVAGSIVSSFTGE